jgi:Ca2+-binding EF-hand superfamily protein
MPADARKEEEEEEEEESDEEESGEEESLDDEGDESDEEGSGDEDSGEEAESSEESGEDFNSNQMDMTSERGAVGMVRIGSKEREDSDQVHQEKRAINLEHVDPALRVALLDAVNNTRGEYQAEKQKKMEEVFSNVFDVLDADHGGTLDVDGELLQTMQKLGLEVLLKDLRIAMEKVIQRKHDRVERVNLFQTRLAWDTLFKEEFIKVMILMSEPDALKKHKEAEEQIFKVFQEFDEDQSGSIDCEELGKAMAKMGRPMTLDQIDNLMLQVDSEGTGSISFVDFAAIFGIRATEVDYSTTARAEMLSQLAEARATFNSFDFDKSNTIDMNELDAVMRAMGRKMTEQQLQRMMASVDTDGSGEIEFEEFCTLLGIEWNEQFGLDLKEIDNFNKSNKDKDKKKNDMTKEEASQSANQVISLGEDAPLGVCAHQDSGGFKFIKYSPNGDLIGLCCNDGSVRIFEVKQNGKAKRLCSLREHSHHALCIAWSPKSDRLVSVSADRMMHMWHIKTATCVQSTKAHSAYVRSVAWSPNGTMIATASSDKTVKMWNPITLQQTKLMLGHSNWVRIVCFRADSKRLVSCGDDNFLIIWNVPEGQIVQRISGFKSTISDACFLCMPHYRLPPFVTSQLNGDISIWHPDVGLHGFMHYTIVGIENMYPSPEDMQRYAIFEVGRNRHRLKTKPVTANSFDFEADTDKMISCSVWDYNEIVRLQLFENRLSEGVRLVGEFKSTHKHLKEHFADGIQQVFSFSPLVLVLLLFVLSLCPDGTFELTSLPIEYLYAQRFHLLTPDEDKLNDGAEQTTVLRMKIRFEPMEHNANLNITVEEGKNMKHPEIKGPISTQVTVRTQRGQEYSTGVVINSKTPQVPCTAKSIAFRVLFHCSLLNSALDPILF